MARYAYRPLGNPARGDYAFRVLDILPCPSSSKDEPINARLRHVSLEDKPQYDCLSYCWGDTAENHEVNIVSETEDSQHIGSISIRDSLHGALKTLRNSDCQRTIWADALCINQQDTDERSSQVSIMALIYWHSQKLIIWLGPDPKRHAKLAFEALKPISDAHWAGKLELTPMDVDGFDPVSWEGVKDLYNNPWFRRTWVQQEIGLSQRAFFSWGEDCSYEVHDLFGFDCCADKNLGGERAKDRLIEDATAVKGTRNIWLQYGQATHPNWKTGKKFHEFMKSTNLLDLLSRAFHCEASDPRDRVYAFLGHPSARKQDAYGSVESEHYMITCGADASNPPIVVPDYSKSVDEVFLELAQKLLKQHKDLRPLGAICHSEESLASAMPTWVPVWGGASQWFLPMGTWASQWSHKIEAPNVEPMRVGHRELLVSGAIIATTAYCLKWTEDLVQKTEPKISAKGRGGWSKFGLRSRRLMCYTDYGLECLVPDVTQPGDKIVILVGGFSPFVIRHVAGSTYKLVGACLVCGWPDHELSRILEWHRHKIQELVLI